MELATLAALATFVIPAQPLASLWLILNVNQNDEFIELDRGDLHFSEEVA